MKTRLASLKFLIVCTFATTTVFGQTTYTWTGAANGTNLATAGNWTTNGVDPATTLPSGASQDTVRWDGVTSNNLVISYGSVGLPNTGFGSLGINLVLTPNQTNSVQFVSSIAFSAAVAINAITNNSASAAFTLGDSTANLLNLVMRPAGAVHYWANNSTNPVTINQSVAWAAGGGAAYTLDFGGSGNWIVNNDLRSDSGTVTVRKSGSGTMTWTNGTSPGPGAFGPITINGGTLVVNGTNTAASTTVNNGTLGGTATFSGPVTLNAGTALAPGMNSPRIGTLTINSDLTIGGNLNIDIDRNASKPNDLVVVSGALTNAGTGTVTLTNVGSFFLPPVGGDRFALFSKPLQNGAALTLGASANWVNNLAVDGSISVASTRYTWTGTADGTNLSTAGNWSPVGQPASSLGDIAQWDGVIHSNLVISYASPGLSTGPPYQPGLRFLLTSNQTNSVQIISPDPTSVALQFFGITNNSVNSAFTLGDNTANQLVIITRPGVSGIVHRFVNNSANAAVINPSVTWLAGGGVACVFDFSGTGNWTVRNNLRDNNSGAGPITLIWEGPGTMTWTTGGTFLASVPLGPIVIKGGTLLLKSSGLCPFFTSSVPAGNNTITNSGTLQYDAAASDTIARDISGGGQLKLISGTLVLSGANTYTGGTTITGGTLQVGTNGTSGSLGSGNVTNNSSLSFNRADSVTFGNNINGTGSVVQNGSGTLTLAGATTYTGPTTVGNGTLAVSSVGGNMNVSGGNLVPIGVGSVGTLNVASNMTISSGTVLVTLNKSLSPSNSLFSVAGAINNSGGTSKLLNFGPSLAVGDKFTLFNRAVTGGAGMTILSPGFTVTNLLAVDGSVTVTTVAPPGTCIVNAVVSGGNLNLSWPAAFIGLHLQVQTNSLTVGLSANWVSIPGSDAGSSYQAAVNPNVSVFYRLAP